MRESLLLAAAVGVLFLLVYWHAATYDYVCPECGRKFSVSFTRDLLGPHLPRKKYLRCPGCNRRRWCLEVRKQAQ